MPPPKTPVEIFEGNCQPKENVKFPEAPPWRRFRRKDDAKTKPDEAGKAKDDNTPGSRYLVREAEKDAVNAAILLRRPLLITGKPGVGKSTLADAVAYELGLGDVLKWPITSRSTLQEGVYRYDAIGRFQEGGKDAPIEKFLRLGPVGTALAAPGGRPKVLLVDELDKADIDLPNDLLNLLEDGEYEIPEIYRDATEHHQWKKPRFRTHRSKEGDETVEIPGGVLRAKAETYPIIFFTSNGEREFSPAFHRRCLSLNIAFPPKDGQGKDGQAKGAERQQYFRDIVKRQITNPPADLDDIISTFDKATDEGPMAADQLLNAVHLALQTEGGWPSVSEIKKKLVFRPLGS